MQGREGLRRHPTSQYQAENGYQHGQEKTGFKRCSHKFKRGCERFHAFM